MVTVTAAAGRAASRGRAIVAETVSRAALMRVFMGSVRKNTKMRG
jgi:hypothetical protein